MGGGIWELSTSTGNAEWAKRMMITACVQGNEAITSQPRTPGSIFGIFEMRGDVRVKELN